MLNTVFSWDAEKLSYYITAVGVARALYLLLVLPGSRRSFATSAELTSLQRRSAFSSLYLRPHASPKPMAKPLRTPSSLISEINFDLAVAKVNLVVDSCRRARDTRVQTRQRACL